MKNYEITEEQIKQLAKGNTKVKEWFPEVFKTELEVGKWYKRIRGNTLSFICGQKGNAKVKSYGFNDNIFYNDTESDIHWGYMNQLEEWTPATDSEVLKALTNEAIKRGFKEGVFITRSFDALLKDSLIYLNKFSQDKKFHYDIEQDYLEMHGFVIYSKGQWAEIVKTYTKEEAEKLLNAKII